MAAMTTTYYEAGRGWNARVAERNAELLAQQPLRRRGVRTPEFHFPRHFDNSRLVKAPDPVRVREMRIFCAAACCEHEHWRIAASLAQSTHYAEAVAAGKHYVQKNGGGSFFGCVLGEQPGERTVAIGFMMSAITFGGEVIDEALRKVLFIFDDGN